MTTSSNNITETDDVTNGETTSSFIEDLTSASTDLKNSTLGISFTSISGTTLESTVADSTVESTVTESTTSSTILNALKDILTTKDTITPSIGLEQQQTTAPLEDSKEGLTDMQKWFLVTACLIGACLILMIINALLHYKETVMNELRKRDIGQNKRVRRDGMAGDGDDRKEYQTHVFYHPFTARGMEDQKRSNSNAKDSSNHL